MYKDLRQFLQEIENNTGISLAIFDTDGNFLVGDKQDGEIPLTNFSGSEVGTNQDKTYFSLKLNGKKYIARISGASEKERAFAFLICKLADKGENKFTDAKSFIRSLLLGEIESSQIQALSKQFYIANKPLSVLAVVCEKINQQEVLDFLTSYLDGSKDIVFPLQEEICIIIKYMDSVVKEYFSLAEYAQILCRSMYEETGIKVKVGVGSRVASLLGANNSYAQAISTVEMMKKIKSAKSVHTFKEFILAKVVEEMPKNRQIDFLKSLMEEGTKEFFEDQEMVQTAQAFLDNDLNASETSRVLFIHRNTLNYRLDKIQNLTGFNLRLFADAVTFRIITLLYKLLG